jgi:anaphase-promoting complex subunit 6
MRTLLLDLKREIQIQNAHNFRVLPRNEEMMLQLLQIENSISLLRGRIYEAMDNRGLAADCFKRALQQDVYCFEAFDLLVSHHMMSAQEGRVGNVLC